MFSLMLIIFVVGYAFIIFEHVNKINKAGISLIIGSSLWMVYAIGGSDILNLGYSNAWKDYISDNHIDSAESIIQFISHHELMHHLSEVSSIVLFLLGAMTIVEVIDQYQGFRIIVKHIKTTNKVKLLWVVGFLTFFMSAILDNLTTTIVMVTILNKLLTDQKNRWQFAGLVIIAANSGGTFSPIGDITTIMLWIGGQITATNIIVKTILPSFVSMLVPLIIFSFIVKGKIHNPSLEETEMEEFTTFKERVTMLIMGIGALVMVPVFKTYTHLPPFMGILLGLGIIWFYTDLLLKKSKSKDRRKLTISHVLKQVDVPTILFFLGILSAVSALQSAGHLDVLSIALNGSIKNIYGIDLIIGALSSVIDNVPLVAASIGMYDVTSSGTVGYASEFVQDGNFWIFLAYCAGTGGSMLIVGSAAGVAAMGMEKINFIWYIKNITWIAAAGYLAGAGVYILSNF